VSPIFIGPQSSSQRSSTPGLGYRVPLLNGEQGTAQTIALMRKLVDEALNDAQFVRQAIEIVRGVAAFDDLGELHALYRWVKGHIRYTKDPVTKEKLYPPQELLKIRAGDCDDISMLLGALAIAIGYPARLITVSANAQSPEEFSHVYVEAEAPGSGNWVPMDAARLDSEFGAEPPTYFRKRAWSLTDDSYVDLSGHKRSWPFAGFMNIPPGGRRLPQFLSGYVGLGQDDGGGIDWSSILQQGLAETPAIIAAVNKVPSRTTSPYGSFQTSYTPGYGIPPAGYSSPVAGGFGFSMGGMMPLLLIGGLILLATRGRS
jgi:Transglutaminase-like superfamily